MKKSSWWSITSLSNLQGRITMLIWYTIKFSVFLMAGYSSHSFFDKLQQLSGWSHPCLTNRSELDMQPQKSQVDWLGMLLGKMMIKHIFGEIHTFWQPIFSVIISGDIPPLAPLLPRQPAWIWWHRSSFGIYMDLAWYEMVKYFNLIQYRWSIMGFLGLQYPMRGQNSNWSLRIVEYQSENPVPFPSSFSAENSPARPLTRSWIFPFAEYQTWSTTEVENFPWFRNVSDIDLWRQDDLSYQYCRHFHALHDRWIGIVIVHQRQI